MSAPDYMARHRGYGPIVQVTIYRDHAGVWCFASWTGPIGAAGAFDCGETLDDVDDEAGARGLIARWWPGIPIVRVPDVDPACPDDAGPGERPAAWEGCDVMSPAETGDTGSAPRPMFD